MKKCVYCTAENRDEAIFCNQCRRPLPIKPRPPRIVVVWLLLVAFLIGFGSYLFSPSSLSGAKPSATPTARPTPIPIPGQTRQPATILTCVEDPTNIRRGPGTNYETIAGLASGACLTILGRNEEASWVFIISEEDLSGWVAATVLPGIGDIQRVSVRDDSILVNTSRPTLTSGEIAHGARLYLTRVAATNNPRSPLIEYVEPCFEAFERIGDEITCRMERAYCDYFPEVEGSPTVCVDRPAPDHTFALIAFDRDWRELDGKCLIIKGHLDIDWGVLQIHALRSDQVSTCDEGH